MLEMSPETYSGPQLLHVGRKSEDPGSPTAIAVNEASSKESHLGLPEEYNTHQNSLTAVRKTKDPLLLKMNLSNADQITINSATTRVGPMAAPQVAAVVAAPQVATVVAAPQVAAVVAAPQVAVIPSTAHQDGNVVAAPVRRGGYASRQTPQVAAIIQPATPVRRGGYASRQTTQVAAIIQPVAPRDVTPEWIPGTETITFPLIQKTRVNDFTNKPEYVFPVSFVLDSRQKGDKLEVKVPVKGDSKSAFSIPKNITLAIG